MIINNLYYCLLGISISIISSILYILGPVSRQGLYGNLNRVDHGRSKSAQQPFGNVAPYTATRAGDLGCNATATAAWSAARPAARVNGGMHHLISVKAKNAERPPGAGSPLYMA